MNRIIDASVLVEIARGNRLVIELLSWNRKRHVAVPEPVMITVHRAVKTLTTEFPGAQRRWDLLARALPRASWTSAVTEKLIELETEAVGPDVDLVAVAHALAAPPRPGSSAI